VQLGRQPPEGYRWLGESIVIAITTCARRTSIA